MNKNKFDNMIKKYEDLILYSHKKSKKESELISAVFLDRDGVIIEDCHYIKEPEDVKLCIGVKKFLREVYNRNIPIVVITNQSGITKNFLSWRDYKSVNNKMIKLLGEPNPIRAIYANSYTSDNPKSNWRKPNPTMILKAKEDLKIDLKKSILVGDRETDLIAGARAGIPKLFHVNTGHGIKERIKIIDKLGKDISLNSNIDKSDIYYIENLHNFSPFNF